MAGQPEAQSAAAAPPAGGRPSRDSAIHGRFLSSATGVADRKIVVGSQRTSTDQTGSFSLDHVPATYDLAVIERDEAWASLYLGLSRRDPAVAHSHLPRRPRYSFDHSASVSGRFWGAPLTEDEGRLRVALRFLPIAPSVRSWDSNRNYTDNMSFGLKWLSWSGPPTISGRLLASIASNCPGAGCTLVAIASKLLELEDGDKVSEDLHVTKLPLDHIAGTWDPAENPLAVSLRFSYELSDGSGSFWVGSCPLPHSADCVSFSASGPPPAADAHPCHSFDCPLPDLSLLPGQYCVTLVDKNYPIVGSERLIKCGVRLGSTDLVISGKSPANTESQATTRTSATQFTSPTNDQAITGDSLFAWEAHDKSIYLIELHSEMPFNLVPEILLFTSKTSFRWNDLTAHGIAFPTGARYAVTVSPIPVPSVDQVASLNWWYGRVPDTEQAEPKPLYVTLVDPTAPRPDPNAPSNVKDLKDFPSGLPACRSPIRGQVLDSHALGRMVTITGNLKRSISGCLLAGNRRGGMNCDFLWQIADVAGSSRPVSLMPASSPRGDMPEPTVPVAASGLLVLVPRLGGPVLEQASLCLPRAAP